MNRIKAANRTRTPARCLPGVIGVLLIFSLTQVSIHSAQNDDVTDPAFERWLKPHDWRRDSDSPALSTSVRGTKTTAVE